MDGLVALITTDTAPVIGILLAANLQRVDESDLLLVGNGEGEGD